MKKERYTFETLEDTNKVRETFRYDKESFDPRNNENFVYKHEANKLSKETNNSSLGKEENDELCYSKKRKKKEQAATIETKATSTSTAVSSTVVAVSTAVIVVGGGMIIYNQSLDLPKFCEFVELTASRDTIYFELAVGNDSEKAISEEKGESCDIIVELHTESYSDSLPIENYGLHKGQFENLTTDTEYTLSVYQNSLLDLTQTLIMEKTIVTGTGDVFNLQRCEDPLGDTRYFITVPELPSNANGTTVYPYYVTFSQQGTVFTSSPIYKSSGQTQKLDINTNRLSPQGTYDVELRSTQDDAVVMACTYNLADLGTSSMPRLDDVYMRRTITAEYYEQYSMYIDTTRDTQYYMSPQAYLCDADGLDEETMYEEDHMVAEMYPEQRELRTVCEEVGMEGRQETFSGTYYLYVYVYSTNPADGYDPTSQQGGEVWMNLYGDRVGIPINFDNMPTTTEERIEPVFNSMTIGNVVTRYGSNKGIGVKLDVYDPQQLYYSYELIYQSPTSSDEQSVYLNYPYYSYGDFEVIDAYYLSADSIGDGLTVTLKAWTSDHNDSVQITLDVQTITDETLQENEMLAYAAPLFFYDLDTAVEGSEGMYTGLTVSFNIPQDDWSKFLRIEITMSYNMAGNTDPTETTDVFYNSYDSQQSMENYYLYYTNTDITVKGYLVDDYNPDGYEVTLFEDRVNMQNIDLNY